MANSKKVGCPHIQTPVEIGPYIVHASSGLNVRNDSSDYRPKNLAIYLDPGTWQPLRSAKPVQADLTKSSVSKVEDCSGQIIYVEWKDFGVIDQRLFECLINTVTQTLDQGKSVEIGCIGAHGRTGTLLTGIVARVEGLNAEDSIARIRQEYCGRAIETEGQKKMIHTLAGGEFS